MWTPSPWCFSIRQRPTSSPQGRLTITQPSPEVMAVLRVIAPAGAVDSAEQAFDAAVAHLLLTTTLDAAGVEQLARRVQQFCQERGHWSIVEGRRRRVLPITW